MNLPSKIVELIEGIATQIIVANTLRRKSYAVDAGLPQVKKFEEAVSRRLSAPFVLGVNSGTDALVLSLKLFDIGIGDEVIVSAFSFISTASVVPWVGAKPVFADITADDYAIDPQDVERKITKKTKAIIVAHLYGQPASRLEEIAAIAKAHKIYLIEDAAQAFCARIKFNNEWQSVGTIGDAGILSFSSTKPLAAPGNAGAVIFKNPDLFERARKVRLYGAEKHYFNYPEHGVNCMMHELQASALIAKIKFLNYWLQHRSELAKTYIKNLSESKRITLPSSFPNTERVWYRFVIRMSNRDSRYKELTEHAGNIAHLKPSINYPVPIPFHKSFSLLGHKKGEFPNTEAAALEVLSLPLNNRVCSNDILRISRLLTSK